jgi:hypothetical protein
MFFNIWSISHAGYVFSRCGSSIDLWCEMVWLQSGITIPHVMKRCTQWNFFIFIFIFCVLLRHGNISFMFFNTWSISHAGWVFSWWRCSIDLWYEMVWFQVGVTIPHFLFLFIFNVIKAWKYHDAKLSPLDKFTILGTFRRTGFFIDIRYSAFLMHGHAG